MEIGAIGGTVAGLLFIPTYYFLKWGIGKFFEC